MRHVALYMSIAAIAVLSSCGGKSAESGCTDSGGTVSGLSCCVSVADFPASCNQVGPFLCACAELHQIKMCNCPTGKCFDGTQCVPGSYTP